MKIQRIIFGLLIGSWMYFGTSCVETFLEQPEGSIITVDSVFINPDNAMKALSNVYATCVVNGFISGDNGNGRSDAGCFDGLLLAACDEGDQVGTGGRANAFNSGTWGPNFQDEFSIGRVMKGMRNACVFIENVDKTPFISTGLYDWNEKLRDRTKSEAIFLRAMMHFEMMKRFGGIPIMSQVPTVVVKDVGGVNKAEVVPSAYRQSFKSTCEFIISSCDEAIINLPDSYLEGDFGRVTKGAALALKARTLLYAASPLFNTSSPYLSLGDQDSLICWGSYDATLWQRAAVANKAVIDWAESNGYGLLMDSNLDKSDNYFSESYNYATGAVMDPRNNEVIYFDHSHGQQRGGANFIRWTCPIYYSWGNTVHGVPINFVKKFRDVNGNDIVFPDEGTYPEFKNLMATFESRFHAIAWWPGSQYTYTGLMTNNGGDDKAKFLYRKGGIDGQFIQTGAGPQLIGNGVPNGLHVKKFTNLVNAVNGTVDSYWPIFRLSEFYLNYAEALNEVNPASNEIFVALNKIRQRGRLPELSAGNSTYTEIYGDQVKTREYIRRERAIELYGEEHRFFDVRRWKIAGEEGIMKGEFYRIFLYENGTGSYRAPIPSWTEQRKLENDMKLSFKVEPFEERIWDDKMYLYPFPQNEVNKGFLKQNPDW